MNYEKRITVPRNTPATAPVEETLTVHPGVVTEVNIVFPDGCIQLVHAQIMHWSQNLWPPYADMDFTGNNEVIDWNEEYAIQDPPFDFVVRAWNDDDTFAHTLTVRMAVLPRDTAASGGVLKAFTDFFGALAKGEL